jgi:hypothetical protein
MRRWENNIKINLQVIELKDVDWIYLTRDRHNWPAVTNNIMILEFYKIRSQYISLLFSNYSHNQHIHFRHIRLQVSAL